MRWLAAVTVLVAAVVTACSGATEVDNGPGEVDYGAVEVDSAVAEQVVSVCSEWKDSPWWTGGCIRATQLEAGHVEWFCRASPVTIQQNLALRTESGLYWYSRMFPTLAFACPVRLADFVEISDWAAERFGSLFQVRPG